MTLVSIKKTNLNKLKIATTQVKVSKSVRDNGIEIRNQIKKGHEEGASIVHFCEGALSGYTKKQIGNSKNFEFKEIRNELELIKTLCRELNIWAVIGSAHELSTGNRPHNSLYIISNQGEIVNRYDKRKCSYNELEEWYTPGFDSCTFEIFGIKFGCALCIEIQFPEIFIEAESQNVDCMLFSSYSKEYMFGIQAQGYAASNNYWISMSIPANESVNQPSQFIGPNGKIIDRCEKNKSSIIVSEIDKDDVEWNVALNLARPWRTKARKGEIYQKNKVVDVRSETKTEI